MRDYIRDCITLALRQLPEKMDTEAARFLMLAAGFQESDFKHRRQVGGPARSYWQLERIGAAGVMSHHTTQELGRGLCITMGLEPYSDGAYQAIEFNDCLAAGFARLLFWRFPEPLPDVTDVDGMWHYYRMAWAPGKPHPHRWGESYRKAMEWM